MRLTWDAFAHVATFSLTVIHFEPVILLLAILPPDEYDVTLRT